MLSDVVDLLGRHRNGLMQWCHEGWGGLDSGRKVVGVEWDDVIQWKGGKAGDAKKA